MPIDPITNPAFDPNSTPGKLAASPGGGGALLAFYIGRMWMLAVVLGGIAVLMYFTIGALQWLTSGGEKQEVEAARNKITSAIFGLVILIATFALIRFLFPIFGFNIFEEINWETFSPGSTAAPTPISTPISTSAPTPTIHKGML